MDTLTIVSTFGGLAIGAIGAFFAMTGPLKREKQKELSFGILYKGLLVGAAKSAASDTKLFYKGEEVERITSVSFSLMNTGQIPIAAADFENPPKVALSNVVKVFDCEVVRCSPVHLAPEIATSGPGEVVFSPMLLNPGDFVTMRLNVFNTDRVDASLVARVIGVNSFHPLKAGRHPGYDIFGIVFYTLISLVTSGAVWFVWTSESGQLGMKLLMPVIAFGGVAALYSTIQDALVRRRTRWMGRDTEDLLKSGTILGVS